MGPRLLLTGFVASLGATVLAGGAGCSSSSGAGGVTDLPSSDPVTSNTGQFCSDLKTYVLKVLPSVAPLFCAAESQGSSSCATDYPLCTALVSDIASSDGGASIVANDLTSCETDIAKCQGVTVGQLSQCISDYASALQSAASGITPQTACGKTTPGLPSEPASCTALPASCAIVTSVVTVSTGSDGG
jgi:hypothetical protein